MSDFEKPHSKRRREVVLTEDDYLRAIDDHVERDYFPETRRLKALGEVLEAEKTGNVTIVDEARERYIRVIEEIADTPRTPDTLGSESHPPVSKPAQSLDLFLRSHTSQDNLSYAKIQDQERTRLKERFWWVYDSAEVEKKRQALAAPKPIPALEAPEALSLNEFQPFTNFMFAPSQEGVPKTLATFEDFSGPAKVTAKENTRLSPEFLVSVSEPAPTPTSRTPAYEELKAPQVPIPITWGQCQMQQPSDREQLGHELAAKAKKSLSAKKRLMTEGRSPMMSSYLMSPKGLSAVSSSIFPVPLRPSRPPTDISVTPTVKKQKK